jgi:hypothetical protein
MARMPDPVLITSLDDLRVVAFARHTHHSSVRKASRNSSRPGYSVGRSVSFAAIGSPPLTLNLRAM